MSDQHSEPSTGQPPINLARRRLARGATAAPVVLGAMASPPVLGGSSAPYHCTISGQQSARASAQTAVSCKVPGKSHGYWKQHPGNWPTRNNCVGSNYGKPIPKAETAARVWTGNSKCAFPAGTGGTLFREVFDVNDFRVFLTKNNLGDPVSCTPYNAKTRTLTSLQTDVQAATCLEVLNMGGGGDIEFCREAVTALLNALAFDNYPLKPEDVIAMFASTFGGGTYVHSSGATKDKAGVLSFWIASHE